MERTRQDEGLYEELLLSKLSNLLSQLTFFDSSGNPVAELRPDPLCGPWKSVLPHFLLRFSVYFLQFSPIAVPLCEIGCGFLDHITAEKRKVRIEFSGSRPVCLRTFGSKDARPALEADNSLDEVVSQCCPTAVLLL